MRSDLKTEKKIKLQKPKNYAVVLVNDDFTPMEFVIQILVQVFKKGVDEATQITMQIHKEGKGVAGIYTHEIAESKAMIVESSAFENEFPLKAEVSEA